MTCPDCGHHKDQHAPGGCMAIVGYERVPGGDVGQRCGCISKSVLVISADRGKLRRGVNSRNPAAKRRRKLRRKEIGRSRRPQYG